METAGAVPAPPGMHGISHVTFVAGGVERTVRLPGHGPGARPDSQPDRRPR